MKKIIITSAVTVVLGLLIAFGPHYLFKVCFTGCCSMPWCVYSAYAETGVGLFIAATGLCMLVFTDRKTHLGMAVGIFLGGVVSLLIPHALIGGCGGMAMDCNRVAFPALTVIGTVVMVFSAFIIAVYAIPAKVRERQA